MLRPFSVSWRLSFAVGAILLVVATGVNTFSYPRSPNSTNVLSPSVTWSESSITVNLSPGQSLSREINLTSTEALENISFFVVPEIANFVTVAPGSFTSITANQPQTVRLGFSSTQGTAVRSYQGTVHLRRDGATIPQTLKITVNIGYQVFRSDGLGLRVAYPYTWEADADNNSLRVFDPGFPDLPPAFEITVFSAIPNPTLSRQENLMSMAQARLGANFLEVARFTNNGVIVKADTISLLHFFTYSSGTNKAVEIRGSSPDFFSSNVFPAVSSSLTLF